MSSEKITIKAFIYKAVAPYKWCFLLMIQAPICMAFYAPVANYAIKLIVDFLTEHQTFLIKDLTFPLILFMGAQIIMDIVWRVSNFADYKSEAFIRAKMVENAYNHVARQSYRFFQDNLSGSISSKVQAIQRHYSQIKEEIHFRIIHHAASIIVSAIFLFFVQPMLAVTLSVWTLVFFAYTYPNIKKLNLLSNDVSKVNHKAFGYINDCISNILTIKLFSRKTQEERQVNKELKKIIVSDRKRMKAEFIFHLVASLLYWFLFLILIFQMLRYRQLGLVTIGDFVLVFGIVFVLAEKIWHLAFSLIDISKYLGELQQSFKILRVAHEVVDVLDARKLKTKQGLIEFKKVSFAYQKGKDIYQNLNLVIKPGEKIGLVGESGAGKTSLISLLLRYFDVQKGRILIDGQEIDKVTQDSLRAAIAVIPQDTSLFHRSLMENIRYGRDDATDKEVIRAAKLAHCHEFISELKDGYQTLVGERGIKLSGGQRQRIAIARAILKDAKILILDEATSALDSKIEQYIQESLNLLIEDKQKTVIAIAHRLSTLKHMDRIIVFDKGKIVEQGSHNSLMRQGGIYHQLWHIQKVKVAEPTI